MPPLVLVPGEVDEQELLEEWLSVLRAAEDGAPASGTGGTGRKGGNGDSGTSGSGTGGTGGGTGGGGLVGEGAGRPQLGEGEWWAANRRRRPERSVNPRAHVGSRARVHVPQRGEKRALLDMVTKNAGEELRATG